MSEIDTLMTCAELALALAGFSGIIVALRRTAKWDSTQRLRMMGLLATAFGAFLFALVPVALSYLALDTDTVWRTSSASMASYVIVALVVLIPRAMADPETRARFPLFFAMWTLAGSNAVLQLANASLLPEQTRFGVYFAGIVLILLLGAVAFAAFLIPARTS